MLDVAKENRNGFYVGGLYMEFKTTDKQLNEWTGWGLPKTDKNANISLGRP